MISSGTKVQPNSLCYLKDMLIDFMDDEQRDGKLDCTLCEGNMYKSNGLNMGTDDKFHYIKDLDCDSISENYQIEKGYEFDQLHNSKECIRPLPTVETRTLPADRVNAQKSYYEGVPNLVDIHEETYFKNQKQLNAIDFKQYYGFDMKDQNGSNRKIMIELIEKNSSFESLSCANSPHSVPL